VNRVLEADKVRLLSPGLLVISCGQEDFYCDAKDLAAREGVRPGWWRVCDREDDGIPDAGPCWVHLTDAQLEEAKRLVGEG
jgi:hypothetical protein